MACEFEVLLNQYQYKDAPELAMQALDLVEQLEQRLSIYKPRSDLSNLNRFGSQRPVGIDPDTLVLLELARFLFDWTGGAFDITAGSLSEVWGFARRSGCKPSDAEIQQALQVVGTPHLHIDAAQGTASLDQAGVQLNPGGIGKGYALDCAARKLQQAGVHDFMMHGGLSSVVARGNRLHPDTGGGWLVSLKHPWRWEEHLGTIRLRDQALGTSGSGKQFFHFGGERFSHIIDPRTGWPAQSMMSATVICPSCALADALATAFFVMGPQAAEAFCGHYPNISAILIYQDQKSGRHIIHTCHVSQDTWQPARRAT
jgi:thiamine biosynthesis lipoprotein